MGNFLACINRDGFSSRIDAAVRAALALHLAARDVEHEHDQRLTSGLTEVHSLTVVHSGSHGKPPSGIDGLRNLYRDLDALGNAPALNALWDEYLWQLLRAWISVRGMQVGTSARHAVALTPELSRQVVAFLVGDPSIHA